MLVRREVAGDAGTVSRVHAHAFEPPEGSEEPLEVALVEELRRSSAWLPKLSLVAVGTRGVVGHVVCSRADVGPERHPAVGLGPIGVLPGEQGRGVGAALMHAVLAAADACDEPLVGVLGAPAYYQRFGFVPANDHGIEAPDAGWAEYFQVRLLTSYSPGVRGAFRYAPAFGEP